MRPIDAGAFGKALSDWCSREFSYFKATYGATPKVVSDTLRKVINMLADQPALDYAPVRHGEWVRDNTYPGKLKTKYVCSACAHWQMHRTNKEPSMEAIYMRYCPNCGAKMDGGKKDG